jgi:hypothetical protein
VQSVNDWRDKLLSNPAEHDVESIGCVFPSPARSVVEPGFRLGAFLPE